jgi:GGDEF domain-containing protein
MLKHTALVNPAARPAGLAALRLAIGMALAAALAAVAIGVGAVVSGGTWSGTVACSLVIGGIAILSTALLVVTVHLYRARAELVRRHAELEDMASVDALTGVPNRRAFERQLERNVRPGADVALVLIDLDNLKSINDSVGHSVGDEVLRGTAVRIQSCLRTTDTVSRLSGDEFAVLLPRVGARSNLEVISRRIVEAVQRPYPFLTRMCDPGSRNPYVTECAVNLSQGGRDTVIRGVAPSAYALPRCSSTPLWSIPPRGPLAWRRSASPSVWRWRRPSRRWPSGWGPWSPAAPGAERSPAAWSSAALRS